MTDGINTKPDWLDLDANNFDNDGIQLITKSYSLAIDSGYQFDEKDTLLHQLLCELKSDATLVAAGLLVWPWREEKVNADSVENKVGAVIVELLQALDSLGLIDRLHEKDQSNVEQLRKMLLAMASDMRAVILKLALQVVTMRRISEYPYQEQQRLALQTRDIFAPLANRMGIAQLKWELEDCGLQILEPDIYQELELALKENREDREKYITRIIEILKKEFSREHLTVKRIYGRVKHINSIYLKMKRKNLRFDQVNDIRAVRVEVATKSECYQVLSIINSLWLPVAEEFDDYIAHPKSNGYQSLHCTLIGPENLTLEVQIRTQEMHENAELGVAAHWKYKEKGVRHSKQFEQQIDWLRRMLDGSGDQRRGDVVFDQFRNEAFKDRVYAVTPEGRVIDLPEGSTPLDFAYHVHTQLGHRCRGAKINGQIMPLTTSLKNGDSVVILTQKEANPSADWLSEHLGYLRSARAKAKVRSYFKKLKKEKSIELGKDILAKEKKRLNVSIDTDNLKVLIKKFNLHSENDLYAGVGFGDISALTVLHELLALSQKDVETEKPTLEERISRIPVKSTNKRVKGSVVIEGVGDVMINFSTCCQPVPPTKITGFITQGRGINIHRSDCQNITHLASVHPDRIVEAKWNSQSNAIYSIDIAIEAYDRAHLLRDISQLFANERVPILNISMEHDKQDFLKGKLTIEINDMGQLSRLLDRLYQIKDIKYVGRL